jgi:hypothetical protein
MKCRMCGKERDVFKITLPNMILWAFIDDFGAEYTALLCSQCVDDIIRICILIMERPDVFLRF